ncbi:hypothetical protein C8R46DRAFT_1232998 [Mycena filopes]|nr:hypothetical protein C8R46DRAFT_1232998 [Mycena filopes]
MSGFQFYKDASGRVPTAGFGDIDKQFWGALNCSLNLIPTEAMNFIDNAAYQSGTAPRLPDGRFKFMEWSLHPDWHRHDTDWRAWIPLPPFSPEDRLWFFDWDVLELEVETNTFQKKVLMQEKYMSHLMDAVAAIEDVMKRPPFTPYHPHPRPFDYSILSAGYDSLDDIALALGDARRHMVDCLGFFNWLEETSPL